MQAPRASFLKTCAAFAALLTCGAHAARAQEPPKAQTTAAAPQPAPKGTITGRIVGESDEPITEAVVSLAPHASGMRVPGPPATAGVDEAGGFRFDGLDPGLYDIYTATPGFVTETDPLTGRIMGLYRPGDNVTIRLVKGGVLTGTVTDAQGQPVAALNVRATRVRDLDGTAPPGLFSSGGDDRTDDRGVYRIYGLRPGLYLIQAGGYGNAPLPFFAGSGEAAAFYPSGTRDTAAEVSVRAGQEMSGLDIRLRDDPARRVTGTVEVSAGVNSEFGVMVSLVYASTTMPAGMSAVGLNNTPDRSFSFDGIADGEYDIQAVVYGREATTNASAPQRVSVRGADVTGLRLVLAPLASASGTLRVEPAAEPGRPAPEACKAVRTSTLPQETLVTATVEKSSATPARLLSRLPASQSATPDSSGAFSVRTLEAGRYRLSVRLFDEGLYVRSVQAPAPVPQRPGAAAAQAPSRDTFTLQAGQQLSGLSVRVAGGAASFAGTVTAAEPATGAPSAPPPFAQLRVYLVPQERERAEDTLRYYEAPIGPEGAYAFKHLAPGRYLLLARPFAPGAGESEPRPLALDPGTRAQLRREAEAAGTQVELGPCQRTNDFALRFPPPTK